MSKDPSSREPGLPFIQGTTDLETGLYLVIDQENMTPSSFKSDFCSWIWSFPLKQFK